MFAVALTAAIVLDAVIVVWLAHDAQWSLHAGPIRVRLRDAVRPFAAGVAMLATLAALAWRSPAWRRVTWILLAAFGAAGLLAMAIRAQPVHEVSDGAILEIYTLQAMGGRLLLGPYSRFGWHHPGPLYLYLLAPWYWLAGFRTSGMQAGALAVNLAAIVALVSVLARRGNEAAAILPAAVAYYAWRSGELIVSAWNPHVIVFPMLAFIVLGAALAADGGRARLLWLLAVGSFLVQTHLALAPLVALLGAASVVAAHRSLRGSANRAAWLLLALWMLPLAEQVSHTPGNLTRIVRFFVADAAPGQALTTAVIAWSTALSSAFQREFTVAWGFDVRLSADTWPIVAGVLQLPLLLLAAVHARRTRRPFATWLAIECLLASAVALWAATHIRERIVDHEIFWMSALGALNAGVVLASAVTGITARPWPVPRWATTLAAFLSVVAVVAVGIGQMRHVQARSARSSDDRAVESLTAAIQRFSAERHPRRILFDIDPRVWRSAAGGLLQIYKSGESFAVDDRWTAMFGEEFAANGREDARVSIGGTNEKPVILSAR